MDRPSITSFNPDELRAGTPERLADVIAVLVERLGGQVTIQQEELERVGPIEASVLRDYPGHILDIRRIPSTSDNTSDSAHAEPAPDLPTNRRTLRDDIRAALNYHSAETKSSTPDFILAEFLENCLDAYDLALANRMNYYKKRP